MIIIGSIIDDVFFRIKKGNNEYLVTILLLNILLIISQNFKKNSF